jgi:hypothetical protein
METFAAQNALAGSGDSSDLVPRKFATASRSARLMG